MSKLESSIASFIRQIFKRENQRSELGLSSKDLVVHASQTMGTAFDMMNTDLNGMFTLDRGMLSRFSDYEIMDQYGEISAALDLFADEATQTDMSTGKVLWAESSDDAIQKELTDLFDRRIDIENNIWPMARNLCKFGNEYDELLVGGDNAGVVGMQALPSASMRRIETFNGDLIGYVQSFSGDLNYSPEQFAKLKKEQFSAKSPSKDIAIFEDWRVVHMRLISKHRESLYGWSVIDPARWIWKRLMLLEDAVLVYKLSRSPSRYAFYIDTSKMPRHEQERQIRAVMQRLKKRQFVNPQTGKLDLRASPLGMDQDFFFGVNDGKESTRVETLSGPSYQQVEDVEYFLKKLYAAIKVPRAYMGYDESMPSRATLSQQDVMFCRSVMRIQRELRNGMRRVANVNLAAKRIDPAAVTFDVKMTIPSSIFELGQLEAMRTRADVAAMMERHVSQYWLLKNIYHLSDADIEAITKDKASQPGSEFESRSSSQERTLFRGNREDEMRVEDAVHREMERPDSYLGKRLRETGALLRDISSALSTQQRT